MLDKENIEKIIDTAIQKVTSELDEQQVEKNDTKEVNNDIANPDLTESNLDANIINNLDNATAPCNESPTNEKFNFAGTDINVVKNGDKTEISFTKDNVIKVVTMENSEYSLEKVFQLMEEFFSFVDESKKDDDVVSNESIPAEENENVDEKLEDDVKDSEEIEENLEETSEKVDTKEDVEKENEEKEDEDLEDEKLNNVEESVILNSDIDLSVFETENDDSTKDDDTKEDDVDSTKEDTNKTLAASLLINDTKDLISLYSDEISNYVELGIMAKQLILDNTKEAILANTITDQNNMLNEKNKLIEEAHKNINNLAALYASKKTLSKKLNTLVSKMTENIETMKILESNNKISKNKVQSMLASYRNNLINVDESKIDKFIDSINNQNVIMANILNKKDVILSDVKQKKQINIINDKANDNVLNSNSLVAKATLSNRNDVLDDMTKELSNLIK